MKQLKNKTLHFQNFTNFAEFFPLNSKTWFIIKTFHHTLGEKYKIMQKI